MAQLPQGIVIGYDDSPDSRAALDWGAATARLWQTTLTVMHVVDLAAAPIEPAYAFDRLPESLGEAGREVLAAGIARAHLLMPEPSQVVGLAAVGPPAGELVRASKDADLIVTGSRGRGPLRAGLLGSVSYAVTAHAACPAVVVRAGHPAQPGPHHPVVVGVDGSLAAEKALDVAAEMAAMSGATLRVVHVAHSSLSPDAQAYVESSMAGNERTKTVRAQAEATVRRAARRVRAAYGHVPLETEVLYGNPGHVLGPLGTHAGLIVVGTRGHGGFAGLLLGSVSHRIIHDAPCPVMVVRG